MKTYLVTGAAGFIGANYLKYILAKHDDIRVVVLDLLTYAGYLGTIAGDIDNERCYFVKGDICDRGLLDRLFAEYRFDVVVNFAAESHVDRSIENPQLFLNTNILGTQNLLDAARAAWVMGRDEQGYPTCARVCATIRCQPTRCMAHLGQRASLPKTHRFVRTAPTVHQKHRPTTLFVPIATLTTCR